MSAVDQSCGDPDRCPFPDRSFTVVRVDRVDVPIRPKSCQVERCVLRSQSNLSECLVVWFADRSRSGSSAPFVVRSIDQCCAVFGPGFPYKLGQLSSSNKNSGKHKLSPSVKKKLTIDLKYFKLGNSCKKNQFLNYRQTLIMSQMQVKCCFENIASLCNYVNSMKMGGSSSNPLIYP
jgi:hypothetical protein